MFSPEVLQPTVQRLAELAGDGGVSHASRAIAG